MVYCGTARIKRRQKEAERKKLRRQEKKLWLKFWRKLPLKARMKWYLDFTCSLFFDTGFDKDVMPGCEPGFSLMKVPHGYKEPAPARRGRALTATSESSFSSPSALREAAALPKAAKTDVYIRQTQGPLFAKLPYEIRQMIFKAVLGGDVIHFVDWPSKRKSYAVCTEAPEHWTALEDCWNNVRTGTMLTSSGFLEGSPPAPPEREPLGNKPLGKLGLLMTCRQIYSESINFLYSHNTFNIGKRSSLSNLRVYLPPQRWNAIRSITVTSVDLYKGLLNSWKSLILTLSFLTGLESLRIRVDARTPRSCVETYLSTWEDMGPTLLCVFEELRVFNWLKEFEIAVPYIHELEMEILRKAYPEAPFRFVHCDD